VLEGESYWQRQKPTIAALAEGGVRTTPAIHDFHSLDHYQQTVGDYGPRWSPTPAEHPRG
jgi:hypothetical protein